MQKRFLSILALALFFAGLAVFFFSLAKGSNDYTVYAVVLCAPGALMAFLNYTGQKRYETQQKMQQEEDDE